MVDLKAFIKAEIQKNQYDPQVTSRPYEVNSQLRREFDAFRDEVKKELSDKMNIFRFNATERTSGAVSLYCLYYLSRRNLRWIYLIIGKVWTQVSQFVILSF